MKALCWYGTNDVRVTRVPDPKILNPRDAIVKVTLTAICGADLHLLDVHFDHADFQLVARFKRGGLLFVDLRRINQSFNILFQTDEHAEIGIRHPGR